MNSHVDELSSYVVEVLDHLDMDADTDEHLDADSQPEDEDSSYEMSDVLDHLDMDNHLDLEDHLDVGHLHDPDNDPNFTAGPAGSDDFYAHAMALFTRREGQSYDNRYWEWRVTMAVDRLKERIEIQVNQELEAKYQVLKAELEAKHARETARVKLTYRLLMGFVVLVAMLVIYAVLGTAEDATDGSQGLKWYWTRSAAWGHAWIKWVTRQADVEALAAVNTAPGCPKATPSIPTRL